MRDLSMVSDYAWKYLQYIADTPPHKLSARSISRGVQERDHRFVYSQLKNAAFTGLVQCGKQVASGAWMWELTPDGRAALAGRAAAEYQASLAGQFPGPEDDPSGSYP